MTRNTLICRSDAERRRFTDLRQRLRHVSPLVIGLFFAAGIAGAPTFGWLPLLPVVFAAAVFGVVWWCMESLRHADALLVAMWFLAEVGLSAAMALAKGPHGYELIALAMPVALVAAVFPGRVMPFVVAITVAFTAVVTFGFDRRELAQAPPVLMVPIIMIIMVAVTLAVIRDLDIATRRSAVIDQLTGALNRSALASRAAELAHNAGLSGAQVAVIAADVDRFKAINDDSGHATGDAVLREVARRLSRSVGADESLYRYGGEEFVVLLAGADRQAAERAAERMRRAVGAGDIEGVAVTMSFGVAASVAGQPFEFDAVFARADAALYDAKLAGRDRVHAAVAPAEEAAAPIRLGDHRSRIAGQDDARARTRRGDEHPAPDGDDVTRTRPGLPGRRTVGAPDEGGSWLVANNLEREHMLDLNARLRVIFVRCAVIAFAGLVASAPWFGWAILPAPLMAAAMYHLVQHNIERYRHPENWLVGAWLVFQVGIAVGFGSAKGAPVFALSLFTIVVPGMSAIFPRRGVIIGTAFTAVLIVATGLYLDADAVRSNPAIVAFPLALLGTIALIGSAIGRSAFSYRGASVVDQLTGMLNRSALNTRLAELATRTELTGEEVAVVVGDVDHFKAVNDEHGHAVGDEVLRAIAQRMRGCLRTFESAYRVGGEEFAVVLSGVEAREAGAVAERLRGALGREPVHDLRVTMSFGVAALRAGEAFDEDALFARADAALYRAKASGRNRVCLADDAVAGSGDAARQPAPKSSLV